MSRIKIRACRVAVLAGTALSALLASGCDDSQAVLNTIDLALQIVGVWV